MRQIKKNVLQAAKILVSFGLLYLLYRKIPLDAILTLLEDMDLRYFVPIGILLFTNTVISATKWRMFLVADGVEIPLRILTASYLIGSFYNMFLPSNIGGDSYRIVDVARRSKETARTAVSVLADRLSGFLAMITIGAASAFSLDAKFGNEPFFLLPLGLLVVISLSIYGLFATRPLKMFLAFTRLDRIPLITKIVDKLLLSTTTYGSDRPLLIKAMALSFLFQFSVFLIIFLLSRAIHSDLPFIYFCTFIPLVMLLEVLPISINGIGLRDAGYVFFFGSVGMSDIQTRSLALLFLGVSIIYSMVGGIVYLFRILFEPPAAR
jgi:uncharacterized membrane protein YbhN (UPF0104 family)